MAKDKRYKTVKNLIDGGHIKSLGDILETVPKTVVVRDLGMHHQTFDKLINNPKRFTFEDAIMIASLIEVEGKVIMDMIYSQLETRKKDKRKK